MAHSVDLSINHPIPIGNVDVTFEVRQGRQLMGRVTISKGGIDWTPSHGRQAITATWTEFADWMTS